MAGGIQLGGNAIKLKTNGIVLANAGDPCCCAGGACCPDGSPASLTISFAGVAMVPECWQCFPNGTDNGRGGVTAGTINGTFGLAPSTLNMPGVPALPSPSLPSITAPLSDDRDCSWSATFAGPTTHFYWFGLAQDCTDPLIVTTTTFRILVIHRGTGSGGSSTYPGGDHFEVYAFAEGEAPFTAYDGSTGTVRVSWMFFRGVAAGVTCKTALPGAVANDNAASCGGGFIPGTDDGGFYGEFGTGGTAAISTP